MSSFSGLHVGLSSLYAQRTGLETAGHNIANAGTEGYTRQRVNLTADAGPVLPAVHSVGSGAGRGVEVADLQRLRDVQLEARALQERGADAQLRGEQLALSRVEGVLAEPSEAGLQAQLSDFWAGWDDVANQPTQLAARSQLLERATTLADGISLAVAQLDTERASSQEQLAGTVAEVSETARAVAELNRAVVSATRAGLPAHDLADQRDLLVQRLGTLAGVSVAPGGHGAVDVRLGDRALVTGSTSATLAVTHGAAPDGPSTVTWSSDGAAAAVGGTAGGLQRAVGHVLPQYRSGLTGLAQQLHDDVNAAHAAGYDLGGRPGQPVFSLEGGRLSVALSRPDQVAASSTRVVAPDGTVAGDGGGGNALLLAARSGLVDGPDAAYRALVVQLGVQAQTANRRVDVQSAILGRVDAARESQAGVNLDEEMTSLLAYQRAYEGAARFVTAVDQMLDTLINRTGHVGR